MKRAIGIGFKRAQTNYGIGHILGILLKNSYGSQILLEATFIYSLSPLTCLNSSPATVHDRLSLLAVDGKWKHFLFS